MTESHTLDANILFYAIDSTAGRKHVLARDLVNQAPHSKCLMTLQCLGEVYNAISRRKPEQRETAERLLFTLQASVPVVSANFQDLAEAIEQQKHRPLQFWDTLLWATARRYGCTAILTEDAQNRPIVEGVRYLNPFTASRQELAPYLP